ncbi:MAG TPA: hypothetical protein VJ984_12770 [Xanthomonadales bacterium]|nr:hypothetical protein [Xanthomonadales bacterium]
MANKTIYVRLDITDNPAVQVDPVVLGRAKMKWRPEGDGDDFEFVNIDFDPSDPFTLTKLRPGKINVDNNLAPNPPTPVDGFEYTITVRDDNGDLHTTTETSGGPPAPGDRPVIRN